MIFIIILFFIIVLKRTKPGSILLLFCLLYLLSLISNFFIGTELFVLTPASILHVCWVIIVLSFILFPWNGFSGFKEVYCNNDKGLRRFVIIGGVLCLFIAVGCSIMAYLLSSVVENINVFKYGGEQEMVYESLGMSMKPYLLGYILYPVSYLYVPLHFYYWSQKNYKLAVFCFFCSLASVCFGLAYFSRAHTAQYIMIYIAFLWLFKDTFSSLLKRRIVIGGLSLLFLIGTSFILISNSRFEDTDYSRQKENSLVKSSVTYSLFDYFGQWWPVSEEVFADYELLDGFHGNITLQPVRQALSIISFDRIPNNDSFVWKERERLLKEHAGSFIGVSAYFLYDTGILVSLFILLLYANSVKRKRPNIEGRISITRVLSITPLVIIPLFGIFYSVLGVSILLMIYLFFIKQIFKI